MKLILGMILSLGLNAFLAAGVIQQLKRSAPSASQATRTIARADGTASRSAAVKALAPVPAAANAPAEPFHWRQLESDDYRRYIANLRAIKCPEATIQDIIFADLEKVMAGKFRAVNLKYKINRDGSLSDYWKPDEDYTKAKLQRDRETRLLYAERRELIADLLGPTAERDRRVRLGLPDDDGARHPYISAQKLDQARDLWAEFDARENLARLKYQDYHGEEIQSEFLEIARQRDAAMAKLLTPYEKEEFLLRISYVSGRMRTSLDGFAPTEQEFRTIFKVEYQQFLDLGPYAQFGAIDPDDPAKLARIQESQRIKESAVRAQLGEQRYQEYAMTQSADYQQMYQFAQSAGLGKEAAAKVYDIKQVAAMELGKIAVNPSLTPEQRQQAMAAVQQVTSQAVQGVLGQDHYRRYEMSSGRWLRNPAELRIASPVPAGR